MDLCHFDIIVAVDRQNGIGKNNAMPWYDSEDLKRFRQITTSHIIIMGRKTYESISKPLPHRINVIVSRTLAKFDNYPNVYVCPSFEEALLTATNLKKVFDRTNYIKIFVIGGQQIFNEAIGKYGGLCDRQLITLISDKDKSYDCDIFYPLDLQDYLFTKYNSLPLKFGEQDYLRLLRKCINRPLRDNRTDVQTRSLFGESLTFDLLTSFPLLTTKRIMWSSVVDELLFFIRGNTNVNDMKTKIWQGNTSRDFLDKRGLTFYPEGEMGPMYPFQWRHAGAKLDKFGQRLDEGFDQLADLIKNIQLDPMSRRHLLCNWDSSNISRMVLAPCHVTYQLYVEDSYIDAIMYQRSADIFLGVPFNIASYALLTYIIGKLTNLIPRRLTINFGDVHIYDNHVNSAIKQLSRTPYKLPTCVISNDLYNIDDITETDIQLIDYICHPGIKAAMVV